MSFGFVIFILLIMAYNYFDQLNGTAKKRYLKKLEMLNMDDCIYRLPAGVWENNPTKWPDTQWGHIYSYLINSPGIYTQESMDNFKSLDAHNYFTSGWVQTVFIYKPKECIHVILKADVKPSQRLNDEPHHPWVALSTKGNVVTAHCNCMAGLGESCSHIAALLFKVEAAVRLGYTKKACTDELCKWNQDFVKKVDPAPIAEIRFYKDTSVARSKQRKRVRHHPYQPSTAAEQSSLLNAIKESNAAPVVLSCFDGYSDPFHWKVPPPEDKCLPPSLRKLYKPEYASLSKPELSAKCQQMRDSIKISDKEVDFVYNSTRTQSDCLAWHEQREGRISSSNVHSVLHTDLQSPSKSLLRSICQSNTSNLNTPAILWGRSKESEALKCYQSLMQTTNVKHRNVMLEKPGFLISTVYPFLGASADGVVQCECHGKKVVEVKCPYKHKDSTLKMFMEDKNTCIQKNVLKENHKYYSQVQLQMYVYDVEHCDFVVWTPKFMFVVYVKRNDTFIWNMLGTVETFFMRCLLPELLTRQLENKESVSKPNNNKLYCVCRAPDDGRSEMIGCDNPTCHIKWYHHSCIGLKKTPKGSWFCSKCKKRK